MTDVEGPSPWQLPRGRHGLPREVVAQSQRERLLAGMVHAVEAKGYEATSVADVLEASGVGRESFYEQFKDKQDCFLAAHRMLFGDLLSKVAVAYEPPGEWPERIVNVLSTVLRWLADNPGVARVAMVEPASAGPLAQEVFQENFHQFTAMLDEGRHLVDAAPAFQNISSIAVGAVFARLFEEILLGRAADLPALLPELTYEMLLPFLGEDGAKAQARRVSPT